MAWPKWVNTPSIPDPIDLKIEEWKNNVRDWLWRVITWTSEAVFSTLGAWYHLAWYWVSAVQQSLIDKNDKKLSTSRQNIIDYHMKGAKDRGQKITESVWNVFWWWFQAAKWVWQVAIHSVRKTVNGTNVNSNKKAPTKPASSKKK